MFMLSFKYWSIFIMFIIAGLMSVSAHFTRSVISWSVFIDLFSSWICVMICGTPTCRGTFVGRWDPRSSTPPSLPALFFL